MRAALLKRAWRTFGQTHFVLQSRGITATVALLLAAANLSAAPTVNWLSGGPNAGYPSGAGYVDGDITLDAEYHTPCGIAVDSSGNYLLVADRDNNKIRVLQFDINTTATLLTYANENVATNLFTKPVGVAIDSSYNIFVLNYGNGKNGTVLEFDYTGELIATNLSGLTNAAGIALDTSDTIYVTASNKVIKVTAPGLSNVVATITAPGASLQGIVVKRGGPTAGLLAVCDSGRNGILLINPNTGLVTTNAGFHGAGDFITVNNYSYSNTAKFFHPAGVAESGDGTLIVSDNSNHRVKAVLASGIVTNLYGVVSNDWVNPYKGFVDGTVQLPDKIGGVAARLPNGVALAPDGSFYVTEDYYHIIRHVTGAGLLPPPPPPPTGPTGLTATAGYGQVVLTWTASTGATNYNIKRSTSIGGPYLNNVIGSTTTNKYTDTNVVNGTTYYYVVSALNAGGESLNSGEASATPLTSPAPNILSVTTNYSLVSLTWSTSPGAISYNIKRSTSSGSEATIASTANTTYNDTSVSNGTTYFYVVSAVNPGGEGANSSEVSATPPIPPPVAPVIGWFDYEPNYLNDFVTVLHPVSGLNFYIANNDLLIAINPTAAGLSTYYITTNGPQPVLANPSSTNGSTSPFYEDGLFSAQPLNVTIVPDLVVKAVNVGPGGNSPIATAEFIFQVGNPTIIGNNAAQFMVNDITTNVVFWYTTDGSDPTNAAPSQSASTTPGTNSVILSLPLPANSNMTFKVRGFRNGYFPSGVAVQNFSAANFVPNTISFGFSSGEASSDFVASPGQFFYAPVTFTALPSTLIYSLQFNITVTNLGPTAESGLFWFTSMLEKPDPDHQGSYLSIPTWAFVSSGTEPPPSSDINAFRYQGDWYQNMQFTDANLLGVGWVERLGATNLYNTKQQDLITYSQAHDLIYPNGANPGQVELGGYALLIPTTATTNDVYQIQIGRPSATSDGVGTPGSSVYVYAPTNGSLGAGVINAVKNVTIGQKKYIVGSVYPFRWFNAGDFGSSNIINADVEQVFEAAAYGLDTPLFASDFFDAMDSCGNFGVLDSNLADANYGYYTNAATFPSPFVYSITNTTVMLDTNNVPVSTNSSTMSLVQSLYLTTYYVDEISTIAYVHPPAGIPPTYTTNFVFLTNTVSIPPNLSSSLFDGSDTNINQIVFGDGVLDVCDVYVTFRRSLDPSLTWFRRFWNNGQRVAGTGAPNVAANLASKISKGQIRALDNGTTTPPQVNFTAGDIVGSAGQTVQIPINATVFGIYPLRVLMLNLNVTPLDGSPALTSAVQFTPNAALGDPYTTDSKGNGNYSAAWMDNTISGLTGTANIGTLTVTIPSNAVGLSAYAIHFDHASASPNGIASFPKQTLTGVITLSSRTNSTYGDGIPDLWRLRWFGTVNNILSVSNACPSSDGISNWQKYVAGVDPSTPNDFPSLKSKAPVPVGATAAIHWPTVSGKQYVILRSSSLFPGNWSAIVTNTGTGTDMEYDDNSTGTMKFYRVQILP